MSSDGRTDGQTLPNIIPPCYVIGNNNSPPVLEELTQPLSECEKIVEMGEKLDFSKTQLTNPYTNP